jgi:hypothetical protein
MAKKNSYLQQILAAQNANVGTVQKPSAPVRLTVVTSAAMERAIETGTYVPEAPKPNAFIEYCKAHGISTTGSLAELVTAFADCNGTGSDRRQLDYRAAVPVDGEGLLRAFALACPEGYNACGLESMERVIKTFGPEARYFLGREGSVALYVAVPVHARIWLNRFDADEISLEPCGLFRLWWD